MLIYIGLVLFLKAIIELLYYKNFTLKKKIQNGYQEMNMEVEMMEMTEKDIPINVVKT